MSDRLPNANATHQLFRGSVELAKLLRTGAGLADISVAAAAVAGLQGTPWLRTWAPVFAFMLVAAAATARAYADDLQALGLRCRRAALHAFAYGSDIDPVEVTMFRAETPWLADWLRRTVLGESGIERYYDTQQPAGDARLRESYTQSALYTWRLLRLAGRAYMLGAVALLVMALVSFHGALVAGWHVEVFTMADLLWSFVLGRLLVTTFVVAIRNLRAASTIKTLFQELSRSGRDLATPALNYDLARAGQPAPPTWAYMLRRQKLDAEWATIAGTETEKETSNAAY